MDFSEALYEGPFLEQNIIRLNRKVSFSNKQEFDAIFELADGSNIIKKVLKASGQCNRQILDHSAAQICTNLEQKEEIARNNAVACREALSAGIQERDFAKLRFEKLSAGADKCADFHFKAATTAKKSGLELSNMPPEYISNDAILIGVGVVVVCILAYGIYSYYYYQVDTTSNLDVPVSSLVVPELVKEVDVPVYKLPVEEKLEASFKAFEEGLKLQREISRNAFVESLKIQHEVDIKAFKANLNSFAEDLTLQRETFFKPFDYDTMKLPNAVIDKVQEHGDFDPCFFANKPELPIDELATVILTSLT
jgi:hypothetical protein